LTLRPVRRTEPTLRPILILLATLALLLACSRVVDPSSYSGSPAAQPARPPAIDVASALDRGSQVAGIVGAVVGVAALVVACVQLRAIRADQTRIAEDLARRPVLEATIGGLGGRRVGSGCSGRS
jgi:hypothetical protein